MLACFRGDYSEAVELARAGISAAESVGHQAVVARGHRVLAEAAVSTQDPGVDRICRRNVVEAVRCPEPLPSAEAYNLLGNALRQMGETAEATSVLWRGLACVRMTGNPELTAVMLLDLAAVAWSAANLPRATWLCRSALRRLRALGFDRATADGLEVLAASTALAGEVRQALVYLGAATALRGEAGSRRAAGPLRQRTTSSLSQPLAETPLQQLFLARAHAARPNARGDETSVAKLMNEAVADFPRRSAMQHLPRVNTPR
jgi:hypothetical protein